MPLPGLQRLWQRLKEIEHFCRRRKKQLAKSVHCGEGEARTRPRANGCVLGFFRFYPSQRLVVT